MKINRKYVLIVLIIIVLLSIVISILLMSNKNDERNRNEIDNIIELAPNSEIASDEMKEQSVMYQDTSNINELKKEYKFDADSEIYNIIEESDGRKTLVVKANINFKVAFVGMFLNRKPNMNEIDLIYNKNLPTMNGIYVDSKDRYRIVNYLNNNSILKSKYKIDENGYLQIEDESTSNENDNNIKKLINGNKLIIISLNDVYYMIDAVNGQVIENPYSDLSKYQTYDYAEDENKLIIFIATKTDISKDNIFEDIKNLLIF